MNELERKVLEMIERGEKLHGIAREIWVNLQLEKLEKAK